MNKLLFCGGVLGLISVVMGAIADHVLDLSPDEANSLEVAIRYNMLYSVLIVILSIAPPKHKLEKSGFLFVLGTICFCFSIYASLAMQVSQITYIVPVGGVLLMIGWITLILAAIKSKPYA